MATPQELGQIGEQIAWDYFKREAYEMLDRNWRHRRAEIDLIVRKEEILVFVEVKTRSQDILHAAERSVNAKKKKLLANAASAYMEHIGHDWEVRFDMVIVIYNGPESYNIRHYEDAFFPGLDQQ